MSSGQNWRSGIHLCFQKQPTTTMEHVLCPGQNSDRECDSQVGAEDQRAELRAQPVWGTAALGADFRECFPYEKGIRDVWKNRSYCCSALPDLGSRTCWLICDHQMKQLPLPLKPSVTWWPFPANFPLSHGRGLRLEHTEDFGASSQAMLSPVKCLTHGPSSALQSTSSLWKDDEEHPTRSTGEEVEEAPGYLPSLATLLFHFWFLLFAGKFLLMLRFPWQLHFLPFFSSIKFFIWFPFFPRHESLFLL